VKQPDSNPLRQELARDRQGEPHPDADVLTALSEGALQLREREHVLKHVAVCGVCREVLGVAAAAAIDAAGDIDPVVVTRPARQQQRAFLPWASIAAGLLVVCSTVLFYQQRQAPSKDTAGATNEAAKLPAPGIQQQSQQIAAVKQNETLAETAIHSRQRQMQAPVLTQGMTAVGAIQSDQKESAKKSELDQPIVLQASTPAAEMEAPSVAMKKAAPVPSVPAFMNDGTERALSAASVTSAAHPHWRINSQGRAERSYGDGAWQTVLPHEQARMRVVSVFDTEVWIGGDHSRLYHSSDNGATWNLIALPDKDSREHSIAHIHFQTAQSGTVKAEDGTVWTTLNGGSMWK
jgi:hypothetical protein